jgi:DNA topoisomerase IB
LQIVKQVAEQLGNTPAVCRKSYIHPMVLENYLDGALKLKCPGAPGTQASVSMVEREVIRLLAARPRDTACGATLKAALKAWLTAAKSKRAALRSALLSP